MLFQAISTHGAMCHQLTLVTIVSATKREANVNVTHNNRFHFDELVGDDNVTNVLRYVRVVLKTEPGDVRTGNMCNSGMSFFAGYV